MTTHASIMVIEATVAALRLVTIAQHRRRVAAHECARAENPQPSVVVYQELYVNVGVVPLPPAQLGSPPHVAGVDATELNNACGDRPVEGGVGRSKKPRHRARITESLRMKGGQCQRRGAALRCTYDRVP